MALYLAVPARWHRRAWKALKKEFNRDGASHFANYHGSKTYGQFLRKWRKFHEGRRLAKHLVPATKYFLLEEGSGHAFLGGKRVPLRYTRTAEALTLTDADGAPLLLAGGTVYMCLVDTARRGGTSWS